MFKLNIVYLVGLCHQKGKGHSKLDRTQSYGIPKRSAMLFQVMVRLSEVEYENLIGISVTTSKDGKYVI